MARKEHVPAALVLPTAPPASIDFHQAKRHAPYDISPPRTPPSPKPGVAQGKGKLRGPKHRPALREAFPDEPARGMGKPSNRQRGDSHDLHWTPKQTRDSVVDNMLLSLDQLSLGGGTSAYNARDPDSSPSAPALYDTPLHLTASRSRGHTFSSSLSSDVSVLGNEPATRSPDQPSRRHRSNSSSNFQSALGRIDSVRAADENTARNKGYEPQRAVGPRESKAGKPTTGRKGSKSSGSSSLDFGQMLNTPGWQRGIERRSSSFDNGYRNRAPLVMDTNALNNEPPSTAPSQRFIYNHDDAAPMPTIPVGPSGNYPSKPVVVPILPPPYRAAQTLPLRRRNSKKAPATLFSRHEKDNSTDMVRSRDERASRLHTRTNSREAPAVAGTWNGFGQSPAVSSRKPSSNFMQTPGSQGKERPGFFRRVFGSSKTTISSLGDSPGFQVGNRTESRNGQASPFLTPNTASRTSRAIPPNVMSNSSKDVVPATLNKKASFFRRRKKSISEDVPLPVPQRQDQPKLQTNQPVQAVEASPVSSLRKVMDPYLSSSNGTSHFHGAVDLMLQGPDAAGLPVDPTIDSLISGSDHLLMHNEPTHRSVRDQHPTLYAKRDDARPKGEALSKISLSHHLPPTRASNKSMDPVRLVPQDTTLDAVRLGPQDMTLDGKDTEVGVLSGPSVSDSVHDMMLAKENKPITFEASHSRSGSNKDLPRLPDDQQPLSSRDNNLSTPAYPGLVPKRTTSKDKRGTSTLPTPTKEEGSPRVSTPRSHRVWLQPTASEENVSRPSRRPSEAKSNESIASDYKSATSKLPTPTVESSPQRQDQPDQPRSRDDAPEHDDNEPTEDERAQAKRIFDGVDDLVDAERAAAWLGDAGVERARIRKAYMELFDWHDLNILDALRGLCNHLLMRGETQQMDRIIDALSHRWCVCNPNHGFIVTDVVHTICYSILLLNTDLHMADIEHKMTRSQFVRNTMPTIRRVATDAAPHAFESSQTSMLPPTRPHIPGPNSPNLRASTFPLDARDVSSSMDLRRPTDRLLTRSSDHSEHEPLSSSTHLDSDLPVDDCGPLVKTPFFGRLTTWEALVEIVLKDFYYSIRQQRLPLSGREVKSGAYDAHPPSNSLSAFTNGMLRRTPSMLSKTGSESATGRGRLLDARMGTGRWSSKTRSRNRPYPPSIIPTSRGSFDDESSAMSPSASSIWSRYSLGKTQTSMSVNSFASSFPHGDYQQSIGFANALSQAIIREEASGLEKVEESLKAANLLEDDSLELRGAPWAKEGILKHKHHLESVDKKAKDRHWNECFAVIEKGWLRLFQFNMNAKSMRMKARNQKLPGGVVGGGNWMENAEALGKFLLRQTIASALPSPGYSKLRPHVWALSLPTGAVHLFQVGTPEIVKEFVTTANYWSARLSKEPLIGGVSNIEYGWGEGIINMALVPLENRPPSNLGSHRPSLQSSLRSSLDQGSSRQKLPGDRITISDWTPPQQSMMASALMEVDQLKALTAYVKNIEDDLQKHNELRGPMLLAFSPRHANHNKAMANWERKSSYLLREIVKFRTYIDSLNAAQLQKERIYAETAPMKGEEATDNETMDDAGIVMD